MVFEQLFTPQKIVKHPEYSVYLGVIYTTIAFLTSNFLFRNQIVEHFIGISTILFTLVLTIPLVVSLFKYEEKLELKKESFFKKHKVVIDFFIYFFIGVFMAFFVLSLWMPEKIFSENDLYGIPPVVQKAAQSQGLPPPPSPPDWIIIKAIFNNNFYVMAITFGLSFFYGSGALFLIILNASIFASALAEAVRIKLPASLTLFSDYIFIGCNLSIMFLHMIPEIGGYLLAAIAGGVLSKAVMKEKFLSKNFLKILKNATVLLILGLITIFIAAIVEVKLSKNLFLQNTCLFKKEIFFLIALVILMGIITLELFRKKKLDYKKIYKEKKFNKLKR